MASDDATLVKPPRIDYILRSETNSEEYALEGEMIIGREVECSISLNSGHVSRYHAKINVMRSGVYLEDLHSTNGTYVNGRKIKGRVRLSLGDEVTFDDLAFRVVSSQSGEQAATLLATQKALDESPTRPMGESVRSFNYEQGNASDSRKDNRSAPDPFEDDLFSGLEFDEAEAAPSAKAPKEKPDRKPEPEQPELNFQNYSNVQPFPGRHKKPEPEKPEPNKAPANTAEPKEQDASPAAPVEAAQTAAEDKPDTAQSAAESKPGKNEIKTDIQDPAPSAVRASKADFAGSQTDSVDSELDAEEDESDRTRLISIGQMDNYLARNRSSHMDIDVGSGPRLIIMTAPLRGKFYQLDGEFADNQWQIGRAPESHVHLTDQTISGDHARLTKTDEGYLISATHAKNGIIINGETVNSAYLDHGDKIQIGNTELLFKSDESEDTLQEKSPAEPGLNLMHAIVGAIVIGAAILMVVLTTKG